MHSADVCRIFASLSSTGRPCSDRSAVEIRVLQSVTDRSGSRFRRTFCSPSPVAVSPDDTTKIRRKGKESKKMTPFVATSNGGRKGVARGSHEGRENRNPLYDNDMQRVAKMRKKGRKIVGHGRIRAVKWSHRGRMEVARGRTSSPYCLPGQSEGTTSDEVSSFVICHECHLSLRNS